MKMRNMKKDICQLTGKNHYIENEKYPEPKLPVIGNTYLYSNNKDIPCLNRYNMKSLQSYKVGKKTISEINNALNYMTKFERKNKTWIQVPGSKDKELSLLIAYVEDEPEYDDDLAKMMGDSPGPNIEQDMITFESLTEQVCSSLLKQTEKNIDAKIKTFVINKIDDGRKQINFSETYSVNNIILSINNWQVASKNHPYIDYRININQDVKIAKPYCPYPCQILTIMKRHWKLEIRNGKRDLKFEKIPGLTLKDIYNIFISNFNEEQVYCTKLLKIMNHQFKGLMINVGHFYIRKELYKINRNAIYDSCLVVSILSILLYKLNCLKEEYMNKIAFNIGRLMMLSDVLHREYCLNVRKGKLPPQLLGNSIMPTAIDFPNRALDLLLERIRIYKAWADTDSEARIGKWAISKISEVALEMSKQEIPEGFNEAERAQVLLGYLAKIEKE